MRTALLEYGFHSSDIVVLRDGQATRPRILSELQRLVARTPSDGIAVFAAASHGAGTSFRTAEGARLYASDLGRYLGRIRAPVWTALAMCYAAGFAVPGVVGPNRIATFSSAANQLTFEIGGAGSELFYAMIRQGMIDAGAPRSVESAFNFAHATLAKDYSNLPVMSDGVPGEPKRLTLLRAAIIEAKRQIDQGNVETKKPDDRPGADRHEADTQCQAEQAEDPHQ